MYLFKWVLCFPWLRTQGLNGWILNSFILVYWGSFILFSIGLHQFPFLPIVYWSSLFSTSSLTWWSFLMVVILTDMKLYLIAVLIWFPWWLAMLSIFSWPVGPLYVFFSEMSSQVLCLFLVSFFLFLILSCMSSLYILGIQFSSIAQSCPILWDPMNRSTPGLPVHHHLLEFTQTHVHWVGDAIQPSHPLSSPSPPTPNPSQHQSLFQWVNSSHEVAKVLEFQL